MIRFRFSLRTLLIVVTLAAIACGYVGWQAEIVRQRRAALAALNELDGDYLTSDDFDDTLPWNEVGLTVDQLPAVPWIRRWLGDEPVAVIFFQEDTPPSDREAVTQILSEARICREPLRLGGR